jgi:hypothetical protein
MCGVCADGIVWIFFVAGGCFLDEEVDGCLRTHKKQN